MEHRHHAARLACLMVIILCAFCGGCGMLQQPSASISAVRPQNVGLSELTMVFDVAIDNPYSVALPLHRMDYSLASRGQKFMSGQTDLEGSVPANGSTVLAVPVTIPYRQLMNAVDGVKAGSTVPYTADLGLLVDVPALGDMRLPMSTEGEIVIPTLPGIMDRIETLGR